MTELNIFNHDIAAADPKWYFYISWWFGQHLQQWRADLMQFASCSYFIEAGGSTI
ncbi:MAG: hypothetical protein V8S99_03695 [Oscillospiraceae bacterium]